MAFYFGMTTDSVSTLFGSLNTSKTNNNSLLGGIDFTTYSSLRNGSYKKLVSAYYSETGNDKISLNTGTGTDSAKKLMSLESSAESLKDISDELFTNGKDSVFNKVEIKDKDGNTTVDYDKEAIYKKVNEYVEAYNDMIEEAGEAETESILKRAKNMVTTTALNEKLLNKVGITIGSDNKLKIDEDEFKNSNMETVKSLFSGVGSLAYNMSTNAAYIDYTANYEATKANTYNAFGGYSYNFNAGSIYNNFG